MPRIVSLVPAGTEIVAALGAEHLLVGISHECDFPPTIRHLPRVTTTPVDSSRPSGDIDGVVRGLRDAGRPVIAVNPERLRTLQPDLILTQDLCDVCAVVEGDLRALAEVLKPGPKLLSLRARTLEGIFRDIQEVGAALERSDDADELMAGLRARLGRLRSSRPPRPPRVVCLEWLEPLFFAGHWVPELVEIAGGSDVGATAGSESVRRNWSELRALAPDLLLVALCGFGVERALAEWERLLHGPGEEMDAAARSAPVWVLDGNAYTSRPGPRVADGAARIQAAMLGRELPGLLRLGRR